MCGGAGHVASQHAMRPRSDIAYPSMPCGPHRGEPCPGMPCGPPTEESHVPACCAATQRGTSHRAASPPGLSWSLQQFKAGILCLIPPPPSGEVQHSSLGLGAARTGRCLRGAARGFTWVSREMEATLPAVAEELLKEIQKAFQETAHVPDDLLLALKFVFGSSAVAALDLVDQHSVTRIVSSSGRAVYQAQCILSSPCSSSSRPAGLDTSRAVPLRATGFTFLLRKPLEESDGDKLGLVPVSA
ncbi:zinc finger SWIM domain-containing protein 7 isoform X7 [Chelonia mydas]|uniref:zinc finger SWIM domain-containing protein 7 isoform X7 n=1 Tax=Chelonia mydas TaxID=8469 RepID=UPI001CA8F9E4|nr:zinc finger SWIM domain-containing protein 7 isoform X7 [Chelonia mydas]